MRDITSCYLIIKLNLNLKQFACFPQEEWRIIKRELNREVPSEDVIKNKKNKNKRLEQISIR